MKYNKEKNHKYIREHIPKDRVEQFVEDIKADAIEEFAKDIINKINFEEKWLFACKSNNADTNIAFGSLRTFCINRSEQLKEQKNEQNNRVN